VLLPGKPLTLAHAGQLRPNTPIISGFNLNDGAMFVSGYPFAEYGMTKSSLTSYFSQRFGEERVTTLSTLFTVPGSFPGSPLLSAPFYAAQRCETEFSYACTALWFTKAAPTGSAWTYQFSEPTGFQGLVLHGAEIDYVFGTLSNPSAAQRAVSQTMMAYWSNFAKDGDPNGVGRGANASLTVRWPAWNASKGALLNVTSTPTIKSVPPASFHGCPFFEAHWDFYSDCLPPAEGA